MKRQLIIFFQFLPLKPLVLKEGSKFTFVNFNEILSITFIASNISPFHLIDERAIYVEDITWFSPRIFLFKWILLIAEREMYKNVYSWKSFN